LVLSLNPRHSRVAPGPVARAGGVRDREEGVRLWVGARCLVIEMKSGGPRAAGLGLWRRLVWSDSPDSL